MTGYWYDKGRSMGRDAEGASVQCGWGAMAIS